MCSHLSDELRHGHHIAACDAAVCKEVAKVGHCRRHNDEVPVDSARVAPQLVVVSAESHRLLVEHTAVEDLHHVRSVQPRIVVGDRAGGVYYFLLL